MDYRLLNQNTEPVGHPMPLIKDLIQRFQGANVFTKIDCKDGYYNIPVTKATGLLTSFVSNDDQYGMTVLGQGLKQSPGIYQCEMQKSYVEIKNTPIFIDDIVLFDSNVRVIRLITPFCCKTEHYYLKASIYAVVYSMHPNIHVIRDANSARQCAIWSFLILFCDNG